MRNKEEGKVGWILLWLLGVPIPILLALQSALGLRLFLRLGIDVGRATIPRDLQERRRHGVNWRTR